MHDPYLQLRAAAAIYRGRLTSARMEFQQAIARAREAGLGERVSEACAEVGVDVPDMLVALEEM